MSWRFACAMSASTAFLILGAVAAAGMEAEGVANAIGTALTKGSKAQATYDSATLDGTDVVIEGFTFSGTVSAQSIRFARTVVEGPFESAHGLLESPRVTFSDGRAIGQHSGSVASITATDVIVLDPETVEGEGFGEAFIYRTAEISDVHLSRESAPSELTIQRIVIQFGHAVDGTPREVSGSLEGLAVSPDLFSHRRFAILARARLRLEELGDDALIFDVDWSGSWDKEAGTVTIRESTIAFRDNAEISLTGTVSRLPDLRVLNDSNVLAQVAQLKLHDLVARYEENSFAARVFELLAKEQEVSRAEYAEQLSQALPFLLAGLTHPAFREELIAGLRVFIQDPRSLTVAIDPEQPMSGSEIISVAKSALGTLPDKLNASVSANGQE